MSEWVRGEFLYEGKAKKIYAVSGDSQQIWLEFKDSLTAYNAQKKGHFSGKGLINAEVASLIFRFLKERGVRSHWVADISGNEMICKKLEIIPIEVVVRNKLAGSTAKKFDIEEGSSLDQPLVEFYYKDDALNDPFISDDQALMLEAAESQEELQELKERALEINQHLIEFFDEVGIELIDFKLEFGRSDSGEIILADEITPDSCRLWDINTGERLDKDRFRRDLGNIEESYRDVLERVKEKWESQI